MQSKYNYVSYKNFITFSQSVIKPVEMTRIRGQTVEDLTKEGSLCGSEELASHFAWVRNQQDNRFAIHQLSEGDPIDSVHVMAVVQHESKCLVAMNGNNFSLFGDDKIGSFCDLDLNSPISIMVSSGEMMRGSIENLMNLLIPNDGSMVNDSALYALGVIRDLNKNRDGVITIDCTAANGTRSKRAVKLRELTNDVALSIILGYKKMSAITVNQINWASHNSLDMGLFSEGLPSEIIDLDRIGEVTILDNIAKTAIALQYLSGFDMQAINKEAKSDYLKLILGTNMSESLLDQSGDRPDM